MPQTLNQKLECISELITKGHPSEAYSHLQSLQKDHPKEEPVIFNVPTLLIEVGTDLKQPKVVEKGIALSKNNLRKKRFNMYRANIHYNMANGYLALYDLFERASGWKGVTTSKHLQNAKAHLRLAITLSKSDSPNFRKQLFVNYGNCLDTLGRGIEAMSAYEEAIRIDENFSMAIGNRAKALINFADISDQYRGAMYLEAYQSIKSIVKNTDLLTYGGLSAKKAFETTQTNLEKMIRDPHVAKLKDTHSKYKERRFTKFEKFYMEFCSSRKLFLNFHIHEHLCEAAVSDPIFISIVTELDENERFYTLAKQINQIKEDYITARLLLVQSQFPREDFNRLSKRTTFVNSLDYSQFNIYLGLLKTAFDEAYSILDKIAVFINQYLNLGLNGREIYFTNIWIEDGMPREAILQSENPSLFGLYDIYKDFSSNHYERIRIIRNASVHRKLVVYSSFFKYDEADPDNIDERKMLEETTTLLQLTKSAIIYLINFVNTEEKRKTLNVLTLPMYVNSTQHL